MFDRGGRLLSTHEIPRHEYTKAIYLVRHVGDVALSYYQFLPVARFARPTFKRFLEAFLRGDLNPHVPWHRHVNMWLTATDIPLHVVRYEDLHRETEQSLQAILNFLEIERDTDLVRAAIADNTIERMRDKESKDRSNSAGSGVRSSQNTLESVIRSGKVGGWRDAFDRDDLALVRAAAGATTERMGYSL